MPNKNCMYYYLLLFTSILLLSCTSKSNIEKEIEAVDVRVTIVRFDKEFAASKPSDLASIKAKYPFFFPKQFFRTFFSRTNVIETIFSNTFFPRNFFLEQNLSKTKNIENNFSNKFFPKQFSRTNFIEKIFFEKIWRTCEDIIFFKFLFGSWMITGLIISRQ